MSVLATRRATRRAAFFAPLILAVALLAGCSLIEGSAQTATQLKNAGFTSPQLSVQGGDQATLLADQASPTATPDRAAEIIWKNLPVRVNSIVVTVPKSGQPKTFSRADLQAAYGDRPATLDNPEKSVAGFGVGLLIAGSVCCLLLVGLVVLVVVLVLRSRRRRRQQNPYGQPPFGG
jgi:hypothetical protein